MIHAMVPYSTAPNTTQRRMDIHSRFDPVNSSSLIQTGLRTSKRSANKTLSHEETELLQLSFDYRILYYFKIYPIERFLAWKGACWCSNEKIGAFPYGPGPDDPALSAPKIRNFFSGHINLLTRTSPPGKRLALADENQLNCHCLVLGMFEMIVRKGLFHCHNLPLFSQEEKRGNDLKSIPENHLIQEMTRLSYRFCSEFREMEIEVTQRLKEKSRIPISSPLIVSI